MLIYFQPVKESKLSYDYPDQADQIILILFIAGFMSVSGGTRAITTAMNARHSHTKVYRHITQRRRYWMIAQGALCVAPTVFVVLRYNFSDVVSTVYRAAFVDHFVSGIFAFIAVISAICLVPITIASARYVYKHPSPFAYRKGELYATTDSARMGTPHMVPRRASAR